MLRNEAISARIEKLSKIKSSLVKERKEYEKYHDYLYNSINALFKSNTKLLSSLKEKYATCIVLVKRHHSIDISLTDQIKTVTNHEKIKKIIDRVLNSKSDDSKQIKSPKEAIEAVSHLVKYEVKDLYSRLQLLRQQKIYEEKFIGEIEELKQKKKKLEDRKRLIEKEITFYKNQFYDISQYNGCDALKDPLSKLDKKNSICQSLRQDKLDIINFHKQMQMTQNIHKKIKEINPTSILAAFDISLDSEISTDNISTLCQSTDNNAENHKNNRNNDRKTQIGLLTSSTEAKPPSYYKYYNDSNSSVNSTTKNKRNNKIAISDNSSKYSYTSSTKSQKEKSDDINEKRLRIIKELSTKGQLNHENKEKVNKSSLKDTKKTDSVNINSKSSSFHINDDVEDYYNENFYSTTSYNCELSRKNSETIIKDKNISSSSTQNEKSERNRRDKVKSSKVINNSNTSDNINGKKINKNNKSESENSKSKNKSAKSEVSADSESEVKIIKSEVNDDEKENSEKIIFLNPKGRRNRRNGNALMYSDIPEAKGINDIHNRNSNLKISSVKSCGSLSTFCNNGDVTRRISRKHPFTRIPVIPPEKCDLFARLLNKYCKDNYNINLGGSFNDSNDFNSFLKKNSELGIKEFDTFTQTGESFKTMIASILNKQLQRFLNEDKINDSIYSKRCQLDELELSVSSLNREIGMRKRKKEKWIKSFTIVPPEKLNKIELNIKNEIEKVDSISQTNEIQSLNKIRDEIIKNSKINPKSFLKKMEQRDLIAMLTKKKLELKIFKMTNVRKQLDINSLLKRLKIVDPLMYSFETHEPASIEVDRNILDKKQQKLDKIASLNRHYKDSVTESEMLSDQISDQQYLVDTITNYLADMAKEPKSNVRVLCRSLKNDRSSINEVNRQVRFVTIENDAISKEICRYDEMVSQRNLTGMNQKVDNLYKYLLTLKSRFNSLRAVKEKRSYVMTCEEEMNSLQRQISMVLSEIDGLRMRINGIISKIEKQLRTIELQNIRNPKPISNLAWNQKSRSSHKY